MADSIEGRKVFLAIGSIKIPVNNLEFTEEPIEAGDSEWIPECTRTVTGTGKWTWVKDKTMSHHFAEITPEAQEKLIKMFSHLMEEPGSTGRFPDGKLDPQDKGEIRFDISAAPSTQLIMIDFGDPVRLIALTVDETQGMIDSLTDKLMELRGIK